MKSKIRSLLAVVLLFLAFTAAFVLRKRKQAYDALLKVPDILFAHGTTLELNAVNSSRSEITLTLCLYSPEGKLIIEVNLEPGEFVGCVDVGDAISSGSNLFQLKVKAEINHRVTTVSEKSVLVVKEGA